ncbi:Topless-related protein 4 [Abeliophyllum distichum]|uniref:Topless-related protein 4 n=1 Tax=Abeliophyllum distichum TaxID=126358 RepID=A0ABD1QTY3_9LAMI
MESDGVASMSSRVKEIVFLILQCLDEEKFKGTVHKENELMSKYGDAESSRGLVFAVIKRLIELNPLFHDKMNFPSFEAVRLRTLINQSLKWQHQLCKYPKLNPNIKTLFVDHLCVTNPLLGAVPPSQSNGPTDPSPVTKPPLGALPPSQTNGARAPSPVISPLLGAIPNPTGFPLLRAHAAFQPVPGPMPTSLVGWMTNPSSAPHPSASARPIGFNSQDFSAHILKRSRTPTNNPDVDYQNDPEQVLKRTRPLGMSNGVNKIPVNVLPTGYTGPIRVQSSCSSDDLPTAVVMTLNQGSAVKSMDFHPVHPILLVVGTNSGEIMIWGLGIRDRLCHRSFEVWDLGACPMALQIFLANGYSASINRVLWSPDGSLCGVAYSKSIVHIYSYHGGDDLRNHLEIEAHSGSVNDLSFSNPNERLSIVTCGEDRLIKVWDAVSGAKQYTFEGHEAPVYSVCPQHRGHYKFIISTATDGKIKAWEYDNLDPRVNFAAPGHSSTIMAYSADGARLFSCGTNKEGDSFLVECNERDGTVKRTYIGLAERAVGTVQFDTTKSRILAAGDEFMIKFWDMDNVNMLMTTDVEGVLPASPCIRFNKEGLLAVSTNNNAIKILANLDRVGLLRTMESPPSDASRLASGAIVKSPLISPFVDVNGTTGSKIEDRVSPVTSTVSMKGDGRSLVDGKSKVVDETSKKSIIWKLTEVNERSQCQSLRLPDSLTATRVSRLMYTNSGHAILALYANAVHKLWKWPKSECNPTGKARANTVPQLWNPCSGISMTNYISRVNPEYAVPCFALSNNDFHVLSTSGGKVSIFDMRTFKTETTFLPPPPAATFMAFQPKDNKVVAIGMDDSSIRIYAKVRAKLKAHQKRITGLAFSSILNVLVSSGADSQLCVWSIDTWEKQTSIYLQSPPGHSAASLTDTHVQFHRDQTHLLAVQETQIAIYEVPNLTCLKQWVPLQASGRITCGTYSCDGQSIYVSFENGSVGVLTSSSLCLRCRINVSAYLPPYPCQSAYPLVIAAHPSEPNQFALGLTDGGVCVIEPLESEGKWGTLPPHKNGG